MAPLSAGSPSAPARWQPGPARSDVAWILRRDFSAPVTFGETSPEPPLALQLRFCPFPSAKLQRPRQDDSQTLTFASDPQDLKMRRDLFFKI